MTASGVFSGYKIRTFARNGLMILYKKLFGKYG